MNKETDNEPRPDTDDKNTDDKDTSSLLDEEVTDTETPDDKSSLLDDEKKTSSDDKEKESVSEPLTLEAFDLPEDLELDTEVFDSALAIINDPKLTAQEIGKQLIEMQIKATQEANGAAEDAAKAAEKAGDTAWDEMQVEWQAKAKALPKIGGENLTGTLTTIKAGLKKVGASKETFEAFALTGAGNHPEVIRVLHALTLPLAESGPIQGSQNSPKLSRAERLYGTNN